MFNFLASDPFSSVSSTAEKATTNFQTIATVIAVLVLVASGVFYIFASRRMKERIHAYWWQIAIGIVVVIGASSLVTYISGLF
ncbi:TrbC/VirB2 family protein [Streptococcus dentiloxodontae]